MVGTVIRTLLALSVVLVVLVVLAAVSATRQRNASRLYRQEQE